MGGWVWTLKILDRFGAFKILSRFSKFYAAGAKFFDDLGLKIAPQAPKILAKTDFLEGG